MSHERSNAASVTVMQMTSTLPSPDTDPASGRTGVDALEAVLDAQRAIGLLFMGRYTLQGAAGRRLGGQGLVQFATQEEAGVRVAIKVCLNLHFVFL